MRKRMALVATIILSALLLSACSVSVGGKGGNGAKGEELPAGAITPVFVNKKRGIKSAEIELQNFTLKLPEGYVYGKVDYEVKNQSKKKNTYTTYYVWMDDAEREYVFATDSCIMLYIYEGVDTNSPQEELSQAQIKASIKSYAGYFTGLVGLRNGYYEQEAVETMDSEYSVLSFTGNGGNYITTTYGDICYPKSYYGFFLGRNRTDNGERDFSGFVFSNEESGEIFRKSEYNDLMSQIKAGCKIGGFNGGGLAMNVVATDGFSYENLVDEVLSVNPNNPSQVTANGIFYKTLLYYVTMDGRGYERWNVDGGTKPTPEVEEETTEQTEEEPHVHTDDCCGLVCENTGRGSHDHTKDCCGFICGYGEVAEEAETATESRGKWWRFGK